MVTPDTVTAMPLPTSLVANVAVAPAVFKVTASPGNTPTKAAVLSAALAAVPVIAKLILNVGGVVPPMMSVPTRSQSGSRPGFRIQACKSPVNGVPGATTGLGADNQKKFPP